MPSTELGYVLAQRIGNGAEVVLDNERSRWFVALREVSSAELIALLAVVEGWLRDERLAHAEVCLDGRSYRWTVDNCASAPGAVARVREG